MPVMPGMMASVTPPAAASNTFVQGAMGSTRGWCAVAERSPRRVAVRERERGCRGTWPPPSELTMMCVCLCVSHGIVLLKVALNDRYSCGLVRIAA